MQAGSIAVDTGTAESPTAGVCAGGLDSLGAVEYVNLVGRRLNLQLPSTLVFDYPTAAAVSDYLAAKLAARLPAAESKAAASRRFTRATAVARAAAPGTAAEASAMQSMPVYIQATTLWPLLGTGSGIAVPDLSGSITSNSVSGVLADFDTITSIPADRWNPDVTAGLTPDVAGSVSATRFGGFLKDIDQFDAAAYGLSGSEAINMDPQHRLLLASAAQLLATPGAFTNSTQTSTISSGDVVRVSDTGVFIGISWTEYHQLARVCGQPVGANTAQGAVLSVACGR